MKKENRPILKALSLILQLGITMMVPIFLCLFLGIWLDRLFGTGFLVIVLLVLGMLAGFRNAYYMVQSFTRDDRKE